MNRQTWLFLFLVVVTVGILAYWYWPGPKEPTAEEWYQRALNGKTPAEREKAVFGLSKPAVQGKEYLRKLIQPSAPPEVREAAILALVECRDFQSMPDLLNLLDDPSETIRGRAGMATSKFLGRNYFFNASASPAARAEIVARMRRDYEALKQNPPQIYRE